MNSIIDQLWEWRKEKAHKPHASTELKQQL